MSTWGHCLRRLTGVERRGLDCGKCGDGATHEASFVTAGRHGGKGLVNRLRYCEMHAQDFAERNGIELPAETAERAS